MNKNTLGHLGRLGILSTLAMLLPASALYAQMSDDQAAAAGVAFLGAFMMVFLVIGLAIYIYIALALSTIAKKTNTENTWMAWVPIIQIVLMLNIAKKPVWWIVLFFIPLVGLVMAIIVWMAIAEARGKPNWWGILLIVPVVGIIVPGYLAWSD